MAGSKRKCCWLTGSSQRWHRAMTWDPYQRAFHCLVSLEILERGRKKKTTTNAEICAGWFGLQPPSGQGGGLVTQLPSESSLLLKSETHAWLGDVADGWGSCPFIHPTHSHRAPTKCQAPGTNKTEDILTSLEGQWTTYDNT